MKGDFTRISFDATNHFSQVLMQQGRVTLDADPNEQGAILLHYLRTLARDLIGPYGGPADAMGFELTLDTTTRPGNPALMIGAGRYYVDGVLVENEAECDYAHQPDWAPPADDPLLQRLKSQISEDVWLYLDVWERHVSAVERDAIREPALGGPDTCSRSKVVWQVRGVALSALLARLKALLEDGAARLADATLAADERAALQAQQARLNDDLTRLQPNADGQGGRDCSAPLDTLIGLSDAQLTARLDPGQQVRDPCVISPDAQYRGAENQLYRVEVHQGSALGTTPTFKWSRDNGSVATRWLATEGDDLVAASSCGFTAGCWVELSDDAHDLMGAPGLLVKLAKVEGDRLSVDAGSVPSGATLALTPAMANPKLRRWDQTESDDTVLDDGAVPIAEASTTDAHWLDLEDGIQVQFAPGGHYRSGDYWLVPARVATGSIDWPHSVSGSGVVSGLAQPPRGVEHHYAPLGFLGIMNETLALSACLCTIEPGNSCSRNRRVEGDFVRPVRKPVKPRPKLPLKPA